MKIFKTLVARVFFILSFAVITQLAMADEHLNSEFRIAAGMGQLERVKNLLTHGAEINSRGPSTSRVPAGVTALMLAATSNHLQVVKFLIDKGANINQTDDGGATALIYSTWKGNRAIVALLLKEGADIYAKTRDGRTPYLLQSNIDTPKSRKC